ncbi:MAG: hypothetical protein J6D03_00495 [Clostridia bacterium]|nr:hypothetical protein [Clostridia bacterium]
MNSDVEELLNLIRKQASKNKIVYETNEGLFAEDVDVFANRPIVEILDLLGLSVDKSLQKAQVDPSNMVNEIATINILCFIKEKIENQIN